MNWIERRNGAEMDSLLPVVARVARAHLRTLEEEGIRLLITCGYRSTEEQARLYARGRTEPGAIVTHAAPGRSWHNHRAAYDVVPVENGKAIWDNWPVWHRAGELGEALGIEWAGRWASFTEMPHFQITGALALDDASRLGADELNMLIEDWLHGAGLVKTLETAELNIKNIATGLRLS